MDTFLEAMGVVCALLCLAGCRGKSGEGDTPDLSACPPGQVRCVSADVPCPACTNRNPGTCVIDCTAPACSANGTGQCDGCCADKAQRCRLPEGVCIRVGDCASNDDCFYPYAACDLTEYACVPASCAAYAQDETSCVDAGCTYLDDGSCQGEATTFSDCGACPSGMTCSASGMCIPDDSCDVSADCDLDEYCDSGRRCVLDTTCGSAAPLLAVNLQPNMALAFDRSGTMATRDCDGRTRLECAQEALEAVVTQYAIDSNQVYFGLARYEADSCTAFGTEGDCTGAGCLWLPSVCAGEPGLCTGNSGSTQTCDVEGPVSGLGGAMPDVPADGGLATAAEVIALMSGCGRFSGNEAACQAAAGCTYAAGTCSGLSRTLAEGFTPTAQTMRNIWRDQHRYGLPLPCDPVPRPNYVTLSTDGDANCCGCSNEDCTSGSDEDDCLGQAKAYEDVSYWLTKMRGLEDPIDTFVVGFQTGVSPFKLNSNAVAGGTARRAQCPAGDSPGCADACALISTPEACNVDPRCQWDMQPTGGECECRAIVTPCGYCNLNEPGDRACCDTVGAHCTWDEGSSLCLGAGNSDFDCANIAPACSYFTDPQVCVAAGCGWSDADLECKQCSTHHGNPQECAEYGCTVTPCSALSGAGACSASYGCTWSWCAASNGDVDACATPDCTWTQCSAITNRSNCTEANTGCTWDPCQDNNGDESGCIAPCSWMACDGLSSSRCTSDTGCSWNDCRDNNGNQAGCSTPCSWADCGGLNQSQCTSAGTGCTWSSCQSNNGNQGSCGSPCTWRPCTNLSQSQCGATNTECTWNSCSANNGNQAGCTSPCAWSACADISSQSACLPAAGCSWNDCSAHHGEQAACGGAACDWTACASLGQSSCRSNYGCTWLDCSSFDGNSSGCASPCTWTPCSGLGQSVCGSSTGCNWLDGRCVGDTGGACSGVDACVEQTAGGGRCSGSECTESSPGGGVCSGGFCSETSAGGGYCSGAFCDDPSSGHGYCSGAYCSDPSSGHGYCNGGTCTGYPGGRCSGSAGTCSGDDGGRCDGNTCTATNDCGEQYCLSQSACQWLGQCGNISDPTACADAGAASCTWNEVTSQCEGVGTPACTYRYCYYPVADSSSVLSAFEEIAESISTCKFDVAIDPDRETAGIEVYFDACAQYDGNETDCVEGLEQGCTFTGCGELTDEQECFAIESCRWDGASCSERGSGGGACRSNLTGQTVVRVPAEGWDYGSTTTQSVEVIFSTTCCEELKIGARGGCTALTGGVRVRPIFVVRCPSSQ